MAIPTLSIKGLPFTEETHEKYGTTKSLRMSGKTGKYPSINIEVDGKLCKVSIGSLKTETLDGNGENVWVPVLRLQEIAASVPSKPVEKKVVNMSAETKVDSKLKAEFEEFMAFKAMRAAAK